MLIFQQFQQYHPFQQFQQFSTISTISRIAPQGAVDTSKLVPWIQNLNHWRFYFNGVFSGCAGGSYVAAKASSTKTMENSNIFNNFMDFQQFQQFSTISTIPRISLCRTVFHPELVYRAINLPHL